MLAGRLKTKILRAFLAAIVLPALIILLPGIFIIQGNMTESGAEQAAGKLALLFLFYLAMAGGLATWFAGRVTKQVLNPVTRTTAAAEKLAAGESGTLIPNGAGTAELDQLTETFNRMALKVAELEARLQAENGHLAALNKNYVDLIGFVSHELKGFLTSIVMNVCSVRDEFYGALNERQKRALEGAGRSLDYLTITVIKFLNMAKIEKGELKAHKTDMKIKAQVFDPAVQVLANFAARKGMQIKNNIAGDLTVEADPELMQIAANNLLSNAVKYGREEGMISITASQTDGRISLEVYNDSVPLTAEQQARLFRRFSRLDTPATRHEQGTGLGLFITREIVHLHGGKIWTEAREKGNAFIIDLPKAS